MSEDKKKFVHGPHSQESEMMVLGCMLTKIHSLNVAADALHAKDFYYTQHQVIFDVLKTLFKRDKPADIHLVAEELKHIDKLDDVGNIAYLTTLAQYAGTSAYIEEYIELIKDKSQARKALTMVLDVREAIIENPDCAAFIIEQLQQDLIDLQKRFSPNDKASIGDILSGKKSRLGEESFIDKLKERQKYFIENGKLFIIGMPMNLSH